MAKKKSVNTKKINALVRLRERLSWVFPVGLIALGFLILIFTYTVIFGHAATSNHDNYSHIAEVAFDERDFHENTPPPMEQGDIRNYVTSNNKLVPILMYHHIRDYTGNNSIEKGLSTQPGVFADQLKWLKKNGFTTITFPELFAGDVADKSVILTFDDGYRDNYDVAFPELKKNGQKATFFIITDAIGSSGYMTADMLREMNNIGMSIESHTVDHIDMGKADKPVLDLQLTKSKKTLEGIIGKPVEYLCYPSGKFSPLAETETKTAGYKAAVTTQPFAESANLYELPRVRMSPGESPQTMASAMSGFLAASNRFNWNF